MKIKPARRVEGRRYTPIHPNIRTLLQEQSVHRNFAPQEHELHNPTVVFTGKDRVEVRDDPLPPLSEGQVRVEATRSLVSTGTEMICLQRNFAPGTHWDNWVKYPFHPGYGLAGRVVEVGEGATGWNVGDRVALRVPHRRYSAAKAETLIAIPEGVSDEEAAWLGLAKIVQVGVRRAQQEMGDLVVIIGMGLIGQLAVQYARLMGASEVIAIDPAEPRLKHAAAHGATHTFAVPVAEAREALLEATDGRLADVVYDVTGHPDVFRHALTLPRRFGKVILLGDAGNPGEQRLTSDVITRGLQIHGAHDVHATPMETDENRWTQANMIRLFFTYLERQQMRVSDLITHRYDVTEAPAVYEMLARDRMNALGVIFHYD